MSSRRARVPQRPGEDYGTAFGAIYGLAEIRP